MVNNKNYFAGSFHGLKKHWEDQDRAIKFQKGQSRTKVVDTLIDRYEPDIHQGSWLDTGVGSGFVQSRVSSEVSPILHVGLDFSEIMLRSHLKPYGERVLGSSFSLPFRRNSFNFITNIFSLSDYPDLSPAFEQFKYCIERSGNIVHIDYALGDDYWETRKKNHGKVVAGNKVIGDINLRTLDEVNEAVPLGLRVIYQDVLGYVVKSSELKPGFDLPEKINRKFIVTEMYKPRSGE